MLKNHNLFVELNNLIDAVNRDEPNAENEFDTFCEYHHFRIHERPTVQTHQQQIIEYMKLKNQYPDKPDYKIAELLEIDKTTLTRLKVEFGISRRNKNHNEKQIY